MANSPAKIAFDSNLTHYANSHSGYQRDVPDENGWMIEQREAYSSPNIKEIQEALFAIVLKVKAGELQAIDLSMMSGVFEDERKIPRTDTVWGFNIFEGIKDLIERPIFSGQKPYDLLIRRRNGEHLSEIEKLYMMYHMSISRGIDGRYSFKDLHRDKIKHVAKNDVELEEMITALGKDKHLQDAWNMRLLGVRGLGIQFYLTYDLKLIRRIRQNIKVFDPVREKVLTPQEFCESRDITPIKMERWQSQISRAWGHR